jgi:hypothetical protein
VSAGRVWNGVGIFVGDIQRPAGSPKDRKGDARDENKEGIPTHKRSPLENRLLKEGEISVSGLNYIQKSQASHLT